MKSTEESGEGVKNHIERANAWIAEAKEQERKATKGPWKNATKSSGLNEHAVFSTSEVDGLAESHIGTFKFLRADAALTCTARNALLPFIKAYERRMAECQDCGGTRLFFTDETHLKGLPCPTCAEEAQRLCEDLGLKLI